MSRRPVLARLKTVVWKLESIIRLDISAGNVYHRAACEIKKAYHYKLLQT